MANEVVNGKQLTDKEFKEQQRQQMEQHGRIQQRAEALVRKLGETCDELDRLAEENPELVGLVTSGSEEHKDAYLRLKARLELADATPRCRWVRQDGTGCGSPQMKKHIYCFAHRQMMEARALALSLPALEDANAIQVGLMRIQKALIDDTISAKKAGLLLYSMQLALQNVGQVTFGQAKVGEQVRETVDEEEAFSNQHSAISQKQNQYQNQQNLFTAEDAKDAKEGRESPLMNSDDTDLPEDGENGGWESEFVPMPGGYGFERVRLRMEPERNAVQAVMAPDDRAQSRINLG
jgi:hypothetical protein